MVGGLLSTLKDNGVAVSEESFALFYSAFLEEQLDQIGWFHHKHLAAPPAEGPSFPFGRKWRDGKKGQGNGTGWPEHDRARDPATIPTH